MSLNQMGFEGHGPLKAAAAENRFVAKDLLKREIALLS